MRKTLALAAFLSMVPVAAVFAGEVTATEVEKAIDAAVTANKKADEVGYQWRDADKMIKAAQEAAKAGDNVKALKLATQAAQQGEAGYQQYLSQKGAGPAEYGIK